MTCRCVGDGVNDAPALANATVGIANATVGIANATVGIANATVGIAMGGAGTAAPLETAGIALMSDDLGRLPFAVGLSRRARSVIRQNLYLSLGVIAFLAVATVTGLVGIGVAVIVYV